MLMWTPGHLKVMNKKGKEINNVIQRSEAMPACLLACLPAFWLFTLLVAAAASAAASFTSHVVSLGMYR